MVTVHKNQVCKVCIKNGRPNIPVDITYLDTVKPNGKNDMRFNEVNSNEIHKHCDEPDSKWYNGAKTTGLQSSQESALLYSRLSAVEQECRDIRAALATMAV